MFVSFIQFFSTYNFIGGRRQKFDPVMFHECSYELNFVNDFFSRG